jgi:hypothetical protein
MIFKCDLKKKKIKLFFLKILIKINKNFFVFYLIQNIKKKNKREKKRKKVRKKK